MKKALITGITGQDGMYLAELLLKKGYEVHGLRRRTSILNTQRIDKYFSNDNLYNHQFFLHYGDLTDSSNLTNIIKDTQPDEIYNLAAMSHVHISFAMPEYTANCDGIGTLRILEAVRLLGLAKTTKIYQASTSELYGKVQQIPQTEKTPFYPRSPYAVAKLYAYWITVNYREAYNIFACNGILFNHESPFRGENFVTRKITREVSRIAHGITNCLVLGNLDSQRDWGHAADYVEAMWRILQQPEPEDYVIATGVTTSIRNFVIKSFNHIGIDLEFSGQKELEIATVIKNTGNYKVNVGQVVVRVSSKFYRPTEVDLLIGDSSKANQKLGWKPKYDIDQLVTEMMDADLQYFSNHRF
ncbi:MAG: GDP-mannose 4,6-dehydratase [Sediminibacterium sp.]|nr:GDP-mannose 4,6-dehydratase [Sediminibacterium sp.]